MHVAADHHRRLIALDPLLKFDVAEKALAAPAGRRIRRRRVMHPDPLLEPSRGSLAKLVFDALLDQRPVPPRTHCKEGVADGEAVAVAGNPQLANVADPSRDFFAFGAAFVEVVIARAKNDF